MAIFANEHVWRDLPEIHSPQSVSVSVASRNEQLGQYLLTPGPERNPLLSWNSDSWNFTLDTLGDFELEEGNIAFYPV